jgi:hypothetical protein
MACPPHDAPSADAAKSIIDGCSLGEECRRYSRKATCNQKPKVDPLLTLHSPIPLRRDRRRDRVVEKMLKQAEHARHFLVPQ